MAGIRSGLAWARAAGVRALKTFAQAVLAAAGTELVGIAEMDWAGMLSVGLAAAVLSVVTSLAGLPEVDTDGNGVADLDEMEA